MARHYNFCAGPSTIPLEVLQKAQAEFLDWQGLGASVMEISHRSTEFEAIVHNCENKLRTLLNIPKNYKVIFLQGGAYAEFSLIPLNILGDKQSIDAIDTGIWSSKAIKEMSKLAKVNVIASTKASGYQSLPNTDSLDIDKNSAFLHYCDNETINGVEFNHIFNSEIPIVADMSSNILSKTIDVNHYGVIYGGAQKNIGPSGVTFVIVREDLLGKADKTISDSFNFTLQSQNLSMVNTPPTFALYLMDLVLDWLTQKGGVSAIEKVNQEKATMLYDLIDTSGFYSNPIDKNARSRMNIPFILKNSELDARFLQEAQSNGLINLNGHRSVGGMRASIYNALPLEGVKALCDFMTHFEKTYG